MRAKAKTRKRTTTKQPPPTGEGLPLIAIVGRPNVGKSSLFNRITGTRRSIVTNEPGITRDRIYGTASWQGHAFELVDTGGMVPNEKDAMPREILRQAKTAIDAAAKLVLVVDVRAGLTPLDEELAHLLIRSGKPLLLAANKADAKRVESEALPFHALGIASVLPISAEHGHGVAELLDEIVAGLPRPTTKELEPEAETKAEPPSVTTISATPPAPGAPLDITLNVAIIGRPNVGKSTLLNKLTGKDRAIVSPVAGTTRDAVDTMLPVADGEFWRLIDTAGIRRKGKTKLLAEKLSVIMARRHLERADVAVLLLEAPVGITALDATIAGYAIESGRALVLALNKWDAVEKDSYTLNQMTDALRQKLKFLEYASVVFISALEGHRLHRLREKIAEAGENHKRRISDGELKLFLKNLNVDRTTVPGGKGVKVSGLKQVAASPPLFVVHANIGKLHFSFKRFLANRLRETFDLGGTPLEFKLIPVGRGHRQVRKSRRN